MAAAAELEHGALASTPCRAESALAKKSAGNSRSRASAARRAPGCEKTAGPQAHRLSASKPAGYHKGLSLRSMVSWTSVPRAAEFGHGRHRLAMEKGGEGLGSEVTCLKEFKDSA